VEEAVEVGLVAEEEGADDESLNSEAFTTAASANGLSSNFSKGLSLMFARGNVGEIP